MPLVLSLLQGVQEEAALAENVLAGQRAQKAAPGAGAKEPPIQERQLLFEIEPVLGLYVPTGQSRHALELLLGLYVPAAQVAQVVKPGVAAKKPDTQALQLARPAWGFTVPTGQGRHEAWPERGLYRPGAQLGQKAALSALKVPALQSAQNGAFAALNVPAVHEVQVEDPAPEKLPAGQDWHTPPTPGLNRPAVQGEQEAGELAVVPAGHVAAL
jgi:hypothetical protein